MFLTPNFRSPKVIGSLVATGVTDWQEIRHVPNFYSAHLNSNGTYVPVATCTIEFGLLDPVSSGVILAAKSSAIALNGLGDADCVKVLDAWTPFQYVRGNVSTIAGTNAEISFLLGIYP